MSPPWSSDLCGHRVAVNKMGDGSIYWVCHVSLAPGTGKHRLHPFSKVDNDKDVQGELTSEQIEALLHQVAYGHLGCHADGKTYVVPIGYAYDGRSLFCHSSEGLKVDLMRLNPEVCIQVEVVESLGNWQSVMAWGKFRELHGTEAATAIGLLIDRLTPLLEDADMPRHGMRSVTPPSRSDKAVQSVVYAIDLTEKTGRYERIDEVDPPA